MRTLGNVPFASVYGRCAMLHSVEGSQQSSCVASQHVTNKYTNTKMVCAPAFQLNSMLFEISFTAVQWLGHALNLG